MTGSGLWWALILGSVTGFILEWCRLPHGTTRAAGHPSPAPAAPVADPAAARRDLITTAAAAWITRCDYCGTSTPAGQRCVNCGAPAN